MAAASGTGATSSVAQKPDFCAPVSCSDDSLPFTKESSRQINNRLIFPSEFVALWKPVKGLCKVELVDVNQEVKRILNEKM